VVCVRYTSLLAMVKRCVMKSSTLRIAVLLQSNIRRERV
jgi:hypothetical protein